jgi:hypothetical protein
MISTCGLVLVALIGVLVELVRSRHLQEGSVIPQFTSDGGTSMRDAIDRIERECRRMRQTQIGHGERIAAVEARVSQEHRTVRGRRE